jgi:hypothetical protein
LIQPVRQARQAAPASNVQAHHSDERATVHDRRKTKLCGLTASTGPLLIDISK